MQNAFWEARTSRERIKEELDLGRLKFSRYHDDKVGLSFRFTALSERAMDIPKVAKDLRSGKIAPWSQSSAGDGIAEYPLWSLEEWQFRAFGTERYKESLGTVRAKVCSRWRIEQTGIIELLGNIDPSGVEPDIRIDPYDATATAAHMLYLAHYIGRYNGKNSARWVVDAQFKSTEEKGYIETRGGLILGKFDLTRGARFRAIAIDLEENADATFRILEDRIWETFGIECPKNGRYPFALPKAPLADL
ncbi:hypothetical protein [Pararhizobium gei]|uniref:hypothetical protein n=1 Tax=Pararhizobium gei TaxID=1395951 RepID=UPI0023DA269D|nr:hypothetical protein [Rhizobium gei]